MLVDPYPWRLPEFAASSRCQLVAAKIEHRLPGRWSRTNIGTSPKGSQSFTLVVVDYVVAKKTSYRSCSLKCSALISFSI
jgi:hypothetical protein